VIQMPYKIMPNHPECGDGKHAVVNKDTGEVKACHANEAEAKKHMAALHANEPGVKSMKANDFCLRSVMFTRADNHTDEPGDGRTLEGYAAVFDSPTRIESWEGSFDEVISRGAFKKTVKERTPKLQFDHGRDRRTGSVPIGKIEEVNEDDHGLYVRARLFDNDVVEPIRQAIEAGAIDGMSFRFKVEDDDWRDVEGKRITKREELEELLWSPGDRGPLTRTIKRVSLHELGPVVFPAYESTSVGVRSILDSISNEEREALIQEVVRRLKENPKEETIMAETTDEVVAVQDERESARDEDFSEDSSEDAGRPDTRSEGGGKNDSRSGKDEGSTPVSEAVLKAELEDQRKAQERRIRDAHLRKIGVIK
jgi:uncharacterized protein